MTADQVRQALAEGRLPEFYAALDPGEQRCVRKILCRDEYTRQQEELQQMMAA